MAEEHYEAGDLCPDCKDEGLEVKMTKEHPFLECCSCHLNPPCSYCVDSYVECPECGFTYGQE